MLPHRSRARGDPLRDDHRPGRCATERVPQAVPLAERDRGARDSRQTSYGLPRVRAASDAEDLARVADQILEVDLRSLGWPEPPKALRREVRVASLSEEVQFEGQYQTHEILRPGNAEG